MEAIMKLKILIIAFFMFQISVINSQNKFIIKNYSKKMPDITQTNPQLNLNYNGSIYCGPVALTNGLFWLYKNGYKKIVTKKNE
jgi:hypothetical protein